MKFLDTRRAGWDTETTGPDATEARIVTAAIIARGGGAGDRIQTWLINPGVPIPAEATAVHGIDDAKAQAEGQDPKTALAEIADTLTRIIEFGLPLVAFNTSFDWTVLHYDLQRHGLLTMADRLGDVTPTLVDPHVIDKQYDRYVSGSGQRKLQPTAQRYGIEITDWHTADADADAALRIAEAQFEKYPHLNTFAPRELYLAQQIWRGTQQASLQDYFRRTDPQAVVDPGWPLLGEQVTV